ncbi:hypothetical protein [Clostridium frigidicarnis]|uniref:Uncharacterized protein n=1 Tax=Clostridium frigidicarnis TaxID=84698 RepID=A0A1I0WJ01_9CLOT|nr:hypothetical protein [Clostridium frigidicarnis]SFA87926.1 hypothetical protein SAMN04488528_100588 [Clostridium frigidicarnis]
MFKYRRKRNIPYWYKLIEERKIVNKYKVYAIIILTIDLILFPIIIKEISNYKSNLHKEVNVEYVENDRKILDLYNNHINEEVFKKNLKSIHYMENSIKLVFVFDSLTEGDNSMENLKYDSNIKVTLNEGKYIYYVDI